MFQLFGYIAGALAIICYIPYIFDIFLGKTKPERASWLIWTVLGSIAFMSQLNKGAGDSLWLTSMNTVGIVTVFLLSLKFGIGGFSKKDYFALLGSFAGLVLWYFTKEASVALFIVIIIDAIGGLLTVYKSYKFPETETFITWFIASIGGIFGILAVGHLNIVLMSYPLSVFVLNGTVALAIYLGKTKLKSVLSSRSGTS